MAHVLDRDPDIVQFIGPSPPSRTGQTHPGVDDPTISRAKIPPFRRHI